MNKRIEKNIEGIEVIYNKEKNGIEIAFENKELATQEIRTELKAVGFRYFPKFKKWMARQNDKTIATVKKLFAATSEVEEMEVPKKEAEEITSIFNKVVEKNSLNDWYNTRRKFVKELKDNALLSFDKPIVQQIKDEKIKNYMYRVLKENDTIIDQFIDNKFTVGEKLTIVKESVIGGASISHIIFNNYEEIEEYNKKSIKMTLGIKNKRGLYNTTIEKDKVLIYRNWIDIPASVLYEDTSNQNFNGMATKYGSYNKRAINDIMIYLQEKNILPIINTFKPIF